jgi:hypothetical protein
MGPEGRGKCWWGGIAVVEIESIQRRMKNKVVSTLLSPPVTGTVLAFSALKGVYCIGTTIFFFSPDLF